MGRPGPSAALVKIQKHKWEYITRKSWSIYSWWKHDAYSQDSESDGWVSTTYGAYKGLYITQVWFKAIKKYSFTHDLRTLTDAGDSTEKAFLLGVVHGGVRGADFTAQRHDTNTFSDPASHFLNRVSGRGNAVEQPAEIEVRGEEKRHICRAGKTRLNTASVWTDFKSGGGVFFCQREKSNEVVFG